MRWRRDSICAADAACSAATSSVSRRRPKTKTIATAAVVSGVIQVLGKSKYVRQVGKAAQNGCCVEP